MRKARELKSETIDAEFRAKTAAAAKAAAVAKTDATAKAEAGIAAAPPRDIDALRADLTHRVLTLRRMARSCREPLCRRARRCAAASFRCVREAPQQAMTPDRASRRLAAIHRALQRRAAALGL